MNLELIKTRTLILSRIQMLDDIPITTREWIRRDRQYRRQLLSDLEVLDSSLKTLATLCQVRNHLAGLKSQMIGNEAF